MSSAYLIRQETRELAAGNARSIQARRAAFAASPKRQEREAEVLRFYEEKLGLSEETIRKYAAAELKLAAEIITFEGGLLDTRSDDRVVRFANPKPRRKLTAEELAFVAAKFELPIELIQKYE